MTKKFSFFLFTKRPKPAIIFRLTKRTGGSMDRASDSGSEGWGFESLPVYQKWEVPYGASHFCFYRKGLEDLNETVRWTVSRRVGPRRHLNFSYPKGYEKCKRVPSGVRTRCWWTVFSPWESPCDFGRTQRVWTKAHSLLITKLTLHITIHLTPQKEQYTLRVDFCIKSMI